MKDLRIPLGIKTLLMSSHNSLIQKVELSLRLQVRVLKPTAINVENPRLNAMDTHLRLKSGIPQFSILKFY